MMIQLTATAPAFHQRVLRALEATVNREQGKRREAAAAKLEQVLADGRSRGWNV